MNVVMHSPQWIVKMVEHASTTRPKKNFASSAKRQKEGKYPVKNAGKSEESAIKLQIVIKCAFIFKIPVLILP